MPYLGFYPKPGQARCVQVDRDPRRISLRYPARIGLTGDVRTTLSALLPRLQRRQDRSFLEKARSRMRDWQAALDRIGNDASMPLKPEYVVSKLSPLLADNAMISIDCGALTFFSARHLQLRGNQQLAISGNLATMAPAMPYAIGAQIAYPERQSVALVGDGGFTMLMGELATAVKYKLPIKVILFKNNSLAMSVSSRKGSEIPIMASSCSRSTL
jgi:thiamine pyrophosphate-dependent acetolactate synthase large subunit-like protein